MGTASAEESYLRRAAADGSDFIAERRHRHQQFVVLVEDAAAGGLIQTQQAFTAQHIQGKAWRGEKREVSHELFKTDWEQSLATGNAG